MPRCPSIADIGTATGRFLCQIAENYPQADLRGFDISADLFPDPRSLPSNIRLSTMDVKQPPPREEHSRYDVVHVRLLIAAMNPGEWELAVGHLQKLLKPGGVLQWEENDFVHTGYHRNQVGTTMAACQFMSSLFREALIERFSHGWNELPQIMESADFVSVKKDVVSSDRIAETRKELTINGMIVIFAWARMMTARGMAGCRRLDELATLEKQAFDDIGSGAYVRYDVHIALGFKIM